MSWEEHNLLRRIKHSTPFSLQECFHGLTTRHTGLLHWVTVWDSYCQWYPSLPPSPALQILSFSSSWLITHVMRLSSYIIHVHVHNFDVYIHICSNNCRCSYGLEKVEQNKLSLPLYTKLLDGWSITQCWLTHCSQWVYMQPTAALSKARLTVTTAASPSQWIAIFIVLCAAHCKNYTHIMP